MLRFFCYHPSHEHYLKQYKKPGKFGLEKGFHPMTYVIKVQCSTTIELSTIQNLIIYRLYQPSLFSLYWENIGLVPFFFVSLW